MRAREGEGNLFIYSFMLVSDSENHGNLIHSLYYLCIHDDKKHFFMKRNGSKIFELFCELEKFMDILVPCLFWAFCRIGMRGGL